MIAAYTGARIQDWEAFKEALHKQFKPANTTKLVRDKLANIKQLKSVQSYNT